MLPVATKVNIKVKLKKKKSLIRSEIIRLIRSERALKITTCRARALF